MFVFLSFTFYSSFSLHVILKPRKFYRSCNEEVVTVLLFSMSTSSHNQSQAIAILMIFPLLFYGLSDSAQGLASQSLL